jgi:hypothetical protein
VKLAFFVQRHGTCWCHSCDASVDLLSKIDTKYGRSVQSASAWMLRLYAITWNKTGNVGFGLLLQFCLSLVDLPERVRVGPRSLFT